jgi:GTP-binding protein HflX
VLLGRSCPVQILPRGLPRPHGAPLKVGCVPALGRGTIESVAIEGVCSQHIIEALTDQEGNGIGTMAEPERVPEFEVPEFTLTFAADSDDFDLADRNALRRVAGLSTELADVSEVEYRQLRLERVVLVGVWTDGTVVDAENSLIELAELAKTAGSQVLEGLIQRRNRPDPSTFIGSGKVSELRAVVASSGADTVICDGELSPSQLRTLESKVNVKVIDRTALILDIFAQHAKSHEGKAQVELAQLQYFLPRLRGWGEALSRQTGGSGRGGGAGGGVGLRGPGETKIETDRRRIRTRISRLKREIAEMKTMRGTKRAQRRRRSVPSVAIAGYTNAGKSSLLNRLTGAGVLVENALFATLDPTTRRSRTSDGRAYTLSDTVGFVRHLPHQLVEAFRSTLEEVAQSDLVVHVVDGAHADPEEQVRAVHEVLAEVGAEKVPELLVINKIDAADEDTLLRLKRLWPEAVFISARTGVGLDLVRQAIEDRLPVPAVELDLLLPYDRGDLVARVHDRGEVLVSQHTAAGTELRVRVDASLAAELAPFAVTRA